MSIKITGRGVLSWVPPRSASTGIAGCGIGTPAVCHFKGDALSVPRLLIDFASSSDFLELVFVMQATKNRLHSQSTTVWPVVPPLRLCDVNDGFLSFEWNPRAETQVRSAMVCNAGPTPSNIVRRCFSFNGIKKSRHSRRTVPTSRSQ